MELNWKNAGGHLPEGWTIVPLRDFLINEKSVSVGVMYPGEHHENGIPLIKVGDVNNGKIACVPTSKISPEVDEEYKRTRLTGDELLITLVGNPGESVIVEPHMRGWNAARALAVLRLKDPSVRKWLNLVLNSKPLKHIIDSRLNTTVQKTLNLKDVKELPIPVPNGGISEASYRHYYDLDDKITLNRQINQTLEQMAQALFKSWFVDFDPVVDNALDVGFFEQGLDLPDELLRRAEARKAVRAQTDFKPLPAATRQLFPAAFEPCVEPSLGLGGWVPKGWKVKELGEISSELRRGISPKYVDNGGVLVINQKCIRNHEISYELARRHDRENKKFDGREICIGDVLVNSTGVGTLGRIAQVTHLPEPAVVDSHVTVVRVKDTECPFYTFGQLMLSMETKIEQLGEGSTGQTELSRKVLSEQLVVLPPYVLALSIDASFKSFSEKQALNRRENTALSRLRDTLLPKLISGELSLNELELTTQQGAA